MRPFFTTYYRIVMLFPSCNWVNDDLSDCPTGTWLKNLAYTYNILDVDAASSQVGDITIFAFRQEQQQVCGQTGRRQYQSYIKATVW